ncbi:hypothetical protein D3C85_1643190 [compost metagenome]
MQAAIHQELGVRLRVMQPGAGTADAFDGPDKFHLQHGFFLFHRATDASCKTSLKLPIVACSSGYAVVMEEFSQPMAAALKCCSYKPM